jgi:hypothetical protein
MKHETRLVLNEEIRGLLNEDMVREAVELFNKLGGCNFDYSVVSGDETVRDMIEIVLDYDAYDMYDRCAPSARRWLSAVAALAVALKYCCYHLDIADDFYLGLGWFAVTNDARSFMSLEKYLQET